MSVDAHRVLGDVALRINECVKDVAGQALVHDLDRANFGTQCPSAGSRPVVSVSSTISRMAGATSRQRHD